VVGHNPPQAVLDTNLVVRVLISPHGATSRLFAALTERAFQLALDPTDPETVFATQKRDLWRSHDGGATWRKIMNGEIRNLSARLLHGVAVAPSDPQSLAVFDDRRTFTSRDGGRTWARRTGFGGDLQNQVLAFAPDEAQSLVLGTAFGVFVSRDGGKVWRPAGLTGLVVGDLVFDPTDPKRLYAATWAAGVFVLDPAP